jgi:hypothetical protein
LSDHGPVRPYPDHVPRILLVGPFFAQAQQFKSCRRIAQKAPPPSLVASAVPRSLRDDSSRCAPASTAFSTRFLSRYLCLLDAFAQSGQFVQLKVEIGDVVDEDRKPRSGAAFGQRFILLSFKSTHLKLPTLLTDAAGPKII